jgi:hypothetical protein
MVSWRIFSDKPYVNYLKSSIVIIFSIPFSYLATEIEPVVDLFCPFYIQCLVKDYAPYFVDNVAVSLGRLAFASPSKAGNYLISVLPQW